MDNNYIIKKTNFTLNMWDENDFDEMVTRSTNSFFSKIIKAPKKLVKQAVPLETLSINKNINNIKKNINKNKKNL